jgi:hypothetical protein
VTIMLRVLFCAAVLALCTVHSAHAQNYCQSSDAGTGGYATQSACDNSNCKRLAIAPECSESDVVSTCCFVAASGSCAQVCQRGAHLLAQAHA